MMQATILCCWHGAMQGSFQSFCLQQGQGASDGMAYVAMADMGGVSSSVWKVRIEDVEPTADRNAAAQGGQRSTKSAGSRRRRASVSANGRSNQASVAESAATKTTAQSSQISYATTTTGGSENSGDNSPGNLLNMARFEVTDVLSEPAVRFMYAGSGLPPFVSLAQSFAQSSDAAPKDLARQVEVFQISPTSREQPNVLLTNFVFHDEDYEPSCLELRVQQPVHTAGREGKKSTASKTVLYVGMANGSILKHTLKDES
jgi:hypothetical protein